MPVSVEGAAREDPQPLENRREAWKNARMKRISLSLLLLALLASPAVASHVAVCPAGTGLQPSAAERQQIAPEDLLRCFLPAPEIHTIFLALGHHAQRTVTDPAFASGKLNPDGSPRLPLTTAQTEALDDMHTVLDPDMREGAILRKFVANQDVGGILYGRTVIGLPSSPRVVTTDTVRGFVGLERNTLGLDAGETVAALGLDYEATDRGQFTDVSEAPLHRQVALEVEVHGLHSIRHVMSATGASDAKIPLGKDLHDFVEAHTPSLAGRSYENNRAGQTNPYTALGISNHLGLLVAGTEPGPGDPVDEAHLTVYPPRLNEEDVMTVPTPLASGDQLFRRRLHGYEIKIADYVEVRNPGGTTTKGWKLSPYLSAAYRSYYQHLIDQAAALVHANGG